MPTDEQVQYINSIVIPASKQNATDKELTAYAELLQQYLRLLLTDWYKILKPEHINILLGEQALLKYWIPAFTHSTVDPNNHYQTIELYGDLAMNYIFGEILRKRFGSQINQENGTLLLNKYMSTNFQAELADYLELGYYFRKDQLIPDINIKIKEDLTEALFGALNVSCNDLFGEGFGFAYCYNLMNQIFSNVDIDINVEKDPITQLKEIFDKKGWTQPEYEKVTSDRTDPEQRSMVVIKSPIGVIIGRGYGSTKKEASVAAAKEAKDWIESQGITIESAAQEWEEAAKKKNEEYAKQYARVEQAIAKRNEEQKRKRQPQITQFRVDLNESTKVKDGNKTGYRYSYVIKVALNEGGRLVWKNLKVKVGTDTRKTKLDLMREFADESGIPK